MVHQVKSTEEFKKAIAEHKIVVVDFYATWCGPCRFIAPKLDEFSGKYKDAFFIKVDVDELGDVAAQVGVQAMPTFKIYKDGKEFKEVIGADANKLEAAIKASL